MKKTIEGVPKSFTREQYMSILAACGLDASNILRMTFDTDGVRAIVFERDADGHRIVTGNGWAKHDVYIPVDPYTAKTEEEAAK